MTSVIVSLYKTIHNRLGVSNIYMLRQKSKPSLTFLAVISVTALISLYALAGLAVRNQFQNTQSTDVSSTPLPVVDYNAPEPQSLQELNARRLRSKRYDHSILGVRELPLNVDQLPLIDHFWWRLPPIPAGQSDAVLIGEVLDARAYLSNDKTGVYSEFTIRVERVLKGSDHDLPSLIAVERLGGAVRFQTGRIIKYEVLNQGVPRTGGRYVLFLRHNSEGDDYSLLTGYELSNGHLVSLDSVDVFKRYEEWPVDRFLNVVTKNIKRGK